jgi:DNA modification methylase
MLTANAKQAAKGKQKHLCPMQYDLADRVIAQMSNEGDIVLDPFGGLMTVPSRAVALGRYGVGIELNNGYFLDGAAYCKAAEAELATPSLFDLEATA